MKNNNKITCVIFFNTADCNGMTKKGWRKISVKRLKLVFVFMIYCEIHSKVIMEITAKFEAMKTELLPFNMTYPQA